MKLIDSVLTGLFIVLVLGIVTSPLIALYLSPSDQPAVPKFSFGTAVYVMNGFYKGCKGYISDRYVYGHFVQYDVEAQCPIPSRHLTQNKTLSRVNEEDLVEDTSNI